jgi:hypothetical protein
VTPDQIDTWTDALAHAQPFVDTFGPGIALTLGAAAAYWAVSRTAGHLHNRLAHRREVRRGLRRLQQYADPHGNRQLLDEIHQPRKEERP